MARYVRTAEMDDLEALVAIECASMPENERVGLTRLAERLALFRHHYAVLIDEEKPVGFAGGLCTDHVALENEHLEKAVLHRETGAFQSVMQLMVLPEYRGEGGGALLVSEMLRRAREEGRQGVILAAPDEATLFFDRFGFFLKGVSRTFHTGTVWYDMILRF